MTITASRHRFDGLLQQHLADGLRLARLIAKNHADAEDIFQEASIRAFKAAPNIQSSPRAWFLMIVRNTAITWLATHRKLDLLSIENVSPAELIEVQVSQDTPEWADPERYLVQREHGVALAHAIRALPEGFRQVIVLRYLKGLSYRDIAGAVGIPLGTVMSRLSRARLRLQQAQASFEGRALATPGRQRRPRSGSQAKSCWLARGSANLATSNRSVEEHPL